MPPLGEWSRCGAGEILGWEGEGKGPRDGTREARCWLSIRRTLGIARAKTLRPVSVVARSSERPGGVEGSTGSHPQPPREGSCDVTRGAGARSVAFFESLWSLWSFNERHTAACTCFAPVELNAVVSKATGAEQLVEIP